MNERPSNHASDHWLSMISQASDWFAGPLGQHAAQEKQILTDELARCFGSYLVHNGPFAGEPVQPQNIKRSVREVRLCRAWKSTARNRPGRSASMPPTWSCCSTRWISASRHTACCAKRHAVCAPAGIC